MNRGAILVGAAPLCAGMTKPWRRGRLTGQVGAALIACALLACDDKADAAAAPAEAQSNDPYELTEVSFQHAPLGSVKILIPSGLTGTMSKHEVMAKVAWKSKDKHAKLPQVAVSAFNDSMPTLEKLKTAACADSNKGLIVSDETKGGKRAVVCTRAGKRQGLTENAEAYVVSFPKPGAPGKTIVCSASGYTKDHPEMQKILHHICESLEITG
ncbi:MAG: hypothetical protein AAF721_18840 [Myxococcota bacterium]